MSIIKNNNGHDIVFATGGAAAFDIKSNEDVIIPFGQLKMVSTGLFLDEKFPDDHYLQIHVRSGMSTKGIILANGTGIIDSDYRNEIKIILYNLSPDNTPFNIKNGDRIAQGIITKMSLKQQELRCEFGNETTRVGGFGSTGI